jgi:hypothetical protein
MGKPNKIESKGELELSVNNEDLITECKVKSLINLYYCLTGEEL